MSFWALRHPPIDRTGRCIGQTVVPLALPLVDAVQSVMQSAPIQPDTIVSSDLPRCADLALAIADEMGTKVQLFAALREMSFGEWEGTLFDELDRNDHTRWRAWCADWQHETPPGGESLPDFQNRIANWLTEYGPQKSTVVVTHAGVLRAFQVLGGSSWESAMQTPYEFLAWHQFSIMQR